LRLWEIDDFRVVAQREWSVRPERQGGLNHEDCKVAGLQRSRPGEATGTIDQRRKIQLSC